MEDNKAVELGSKNQKITAHMFWAKGPISELEYLCMKSFVDKNYKLLVWSYDATLEIPRGAKLRDASIVLDESKLFLVSLLLPSLESKLSSVSILPTDGRSIMIKSKMIKYLIFNHC